MDFIVIAYSLDKMWVNCNRNNFITLFGKIKQQMEKYKVFCCWKDRFSIYLT